MRIMYFFFTSEFEYNKYSYEKIQVLARRLAYGKYLYVIQTWIELNVDLAFVAKCTRVVWRGVASFSGLIGRSDSPRKS